MVKVSAPGKMFLSGEWAVLEVGNPGVVAAVNKRVFADVGQSKDDRIHISIRDFGINDLACSFAGSTLTFERELTDQEKKDTLFMKASIEAAMKYLGKIRPFTIETWGEDTNVEIDGKIKKVGFGSSAATVVAVLGGILKFHGNDIESLDAKARIYKLAALTHYLAQGKVGSAFDIAASTYGGVFIYQRFDPDWLMQRMDSKASLRDVIEERWPSFKAEPLIIPEGFKLVIGWTRESASTSDMVKQMDSFKNSQPDEYKRIYDSIADIVREEIPAWKSGDTKKLTPLLRKNEDLLRELGEESGVNIETPDLKRLSDLANQVGAAGKLSGAGGGDCGIAICFDQKTASDVEDIWKKSGFYVVDATEDHEGLRVDS